MKRKDDIMLESYVTEVIDYNETPNPFEESDKVREIIKKVLMENQEKNKEMLRDLIQRIAAVTKRDVDMEMYWKGGGKNATSAYHSKEDYETDLIGYIIESLGLSKYPN